MIPKFNYRTALVLCFLVLAPITLSATPAAEISVSLNRSRPQRGEVVEIKIQTNSELPVHAVLLTPTVGTKDLQLSRLPGQQNTFRTQVVLGNDQPEGLYVIHSWTGDAANATSIGKATFLLGRVVTDFFIPAYLDASKPAADLQLYLKDFRSIGGNFLIAHNLITPTKAYFPSKIAHTDVTSGSANDLVEMTLTQADKQGLPVLLSVSWDMTKQSPFKDRMGEIKAISTELYSLYKHHPSLAGFYSYQEGSGTYFVPFVREFSQHIKSLNPNLLTACAPHVDDPLLAGYLSTVEELDIIIYQAGVMASYRTDNRKMYPFRRVKDFCSLGAGAKRLQKKISINHVELFGYLENRLTPNTTATTYDNIYQQILSAATVAGADGISFFTYQAHVFETSKKLPQVARSRAAVVDGLKAFDLISAKVSQRNNPLAVYFPYSDWIIERWHNYFLPALDGFRKLGVPVDVLPYAPPIEESVYPYYPFHLNKDVLARLLTEKTVLVLPNVSGFQQTDSDLIKAFVEQGGVIMTFGPQIPMGRSYERQELFGIEEGKGTATHSTVVVRDALGKRVTAGSRFSLNRLELPSWTTKGARIVATFEDGSPAINANKYGQGTIVTIFPDVPTAVQNFSELVRDVLDYAIAAQGNTPLVDIDGTGENSDIAVEHTPNGFRVAIVNYTPVETEVILKPVRATNATEWLDLVNNNTIGREPTLKLKVPGHKFRAVEFRTRDGFAQKSTSLTKSSALFILPTFRLGAGVVN
jgi:hypothetical protein